jgi:small-conductance mechanosensitive channel
MMSFTLFKFGPYNVCLWNFVVLGLIYLVAMVLRRLLLRTLKRYLQNNNIRVEGKRITWLRLFSQSVYLLATYVAIFSFNINNNDVSFNEFINFNIINSKKFTLSIYHIFVLTIIFFVTKVLLNFAKLYINRKFRDRNNYDPGSEFVYVQIAKYIIYLFSIIISLKVLDIDLTILLTGSAALLVGIGLGLQDVFKDMFSGIVLLVEGNVRVGDIVEISNGGKTEAIIAKILKINVRTTQIETRDGNVLMIPNAKLTQEYVENWTHGSELTRFRIFVTVEYGSDTELVTRLLKQAAFGHPKVRKTHPVDVRLANFGNNGLELELIFWADQNWDINNYKSDIRFEIDRLFREYKITVPFHQSTVSIVDKRN